MKLKAAAAIMLVLLSCAAAGAQEKQVELNAGHLGIRFAPPSGAARLSEAEAARLAAAGGLKAAFKGPEPETLLTVNTFDAGAKGVPDGASQEDRRALLKKLESEVAASFPAAEWMSRETVQIEGPLWVRLRYKAARAGREVVSDTYAITWFGKVVVFEYLCPAEVYELRRAAFEKSAASIRLTLRAFGPPQGAKPRGRRP